MRARDRANARARGRAGTLASALAFSCDVGGECAGVFDLGLIEDLADILDLADALYLALDGADSRAEVVGEVARARGLAGDLARISTRAHDQGDAAMTHARSELTDAEVPAREVGRSIARAQDLATGLVEDLIYAVSLVDARGRG